MRVAGRPGGRCGLAVETSYHVQNSFLGTLVYVCGSLILVASCGPSLYRIVSRTALSDLRWTMSYFSLRTLDLDVCPHRLASCIIENLEEVYAHS